MPKLACDARGMKCPTDGATLVMSERSGIEIDYCPDCRGVWLDRGELDKIIDRAGSATAPAVASAPTFPSPAPVYHRDDDRGVRPGYDPGYDRDRDPGQQGYRRKKKENWLSELFE